MTPSEVVFLLDVDNTLLDNDRVEHQLDPNLLARMSRHGA
jgi:hypothetical protein